MNEKITTIIQIIQRDNEDYRQFQNRIMAIKIDNADDPDIIYEIEYTKEWQERIKKRKEEIKNEILEKIKRNKNKFKV